MPWDQKAYDAQYREKNKDRLAGQAVAYYEKNKERIATYGAEYREKNKEHIAARGAEYYKKNKKRIVAYREKNKERRAPRDAMYREKNKERIAARNAKRYHSLRIQFNDMYGLKKEGHEHGVCTCCKEADLMLFGTVSHIDGSGAHHREVTNGSLTTIFKEALAVYDSARFAAECYNCNLAAERNGGVCPHKSSQAKK